MVQKNPFKHYLPKQVLFLTDDLIPFSRRKSGRYVFWSSFTQGDLDLDLMKCLKPLSTKENILCQGP